MTRSVTCSCGYQAQSTDEEELYSQVRRHVDPQHPEMHRPIPAQTTSRSSVVAQLAGGHFRVIGSARAER